MNNLKKHPKADEVFLPNGAFKVNKKGEPVKVESIIAPEPDSCCMLDCCTKSIIFLDSNNVKRSISLQDIYDLINP